MANKAKKKTATTRQRHRVLAWVAAGTMAVVVGLVIFAVVVMLRSPESPPSAVPPGAVPPTSGSAHPHKPRPASQDASCPDVLLVDVPGTWESSLQDSPLNPLQFPNALLHNATTTLGQQFPSPRLQTYTTPYTAQFHNPLAGDNQMTLQRQPRGRQPRDGPRDDRHEQQVPVDQLRADGLLAGRGDHR